MKGHLLYNIHISDKKIKNKIKTQVAYLFTANLRVEMSFKLCLLPMYVF